MPKIRGLTTTEKKEGKRYLWSFKTESHMHLLRKHIFFMFEETPTKYYLVDNKVVSADEETSTTKDVDNLIYDFIGHGQYIGSETEDGKLDKHLLTFYKKNRHQIPQYHQQLFETLTAPRRRTPEK